MKNIFLYELLLMDRITRITLKYAEEKKSKTLLNIHSEFAFFLSKLEPVKT